MPLSPSQPYPTRPRLLDRKSYIGRKGYFITINTSNRKKLFTQWNIVQEMTTILRDVSKKEMFDVVAYCFMPDHLHLVIMGMDEFSNLETFVKKYKQITGYWAKKNLKRYLWAYSYYDHVLRYQEDIRGVGIYTLLNPVRAGMVTKVVDYPFLGSFTLDIEEMGGVDCFV